MNLPPLILASASPRRARLLTQLGLTFEVVPGQVKEVQPNFLTPHEIAQLNARNKADPASVLHPRSLVLGADTVVCLEGTIFGKPADLDDASRMLRQLQGRTHQVITGVCLLHRATLRQRLFAVSTHVAFRPLTTLDIARYLATIDPLDKAGAYAIQDQGDQIVESITGSFSNVVGLPVERLQDELAAWESRFGQ